MSDGADPDLVLKLAPRHERTAAQRHDRTNQLAFDAMRVCAFCSLILPIEAAIDTATTTSSAAVSHLESSAARPAPTMTATELMSANVCHGRTTRCSSSLVKR